MRSGFSLSLAVPLLLAFCTAAHAGSPRPGWNTTVHCTGYAQTHPLAASGIITTPLAGMQLIQQPGLAPPKCTVPASASRS